MAIVPIHTERKRPRMGPDRYGTDARRFSGRNTDHRACGRSDSNFDDLSISAIAGDVVALVSGFGKIRQYNGWSIGAAVTVEAALALGDICKAIILTAGATPAHVTKPDYPHGGSRRFSRYCWRG